MIMLAKGILLSLTLTCWLAVHLAASETVLSMDSCPLAQNRLSRAYSPQHYNLTIEPDLRSMRFAGQVEIVVKYTADFNGFTCEKSKKSLGAVIGDVCRRVLFCGPKDQDDLCRRRILLNVGQNIQVASVQVLSAANAAQDDHQQALVLPVESVCRDEKHELLEITLESLPQVDQELRIQLAFQGKIGSESRGLYKSRQVNLLDSSSYLNVNTHFMPADARSAFPCFDQPDLKATFELKLRHNKELESFSNTQLVSSEPVEGDADKKVNTFARTPRMSTYVFAFAVGHYDSISCHAEARRSRDIEVRAYTPVGRSQEARFTLDTVCKAIPVVERYFNMDFPLDKLDLVATNQMRDPARENWGLLIFTEDFLLTDDKETTNVLRAEIAKLTVHVVLHHWMGDLMTARWWDDQWLFDGFTIWKSHWVAAEIYPEFNYVYNYLLRLVSPMLDAHAASRNVHAIKTYQNLDANQELGLFDANTYNKAGALYQMMSTAIIGDITLRDSLARLIELNKYGTCNADDFFQAVHRVTGLEVEPILRSWLDQAGIPVVSVKRVGNELELQQSRLENEPTAEGSNQIWHIPVVIQFGDLSSTRSDTKKVMFSTRTTRVPLPVWFDPYNADHWLKVNQDFNGFYRVHYNDNYLFKRLRAPIERAILSPANRLNLIDDLRGLLKITGGPQPLVSIDDVKDHLSWFAADLDGGVLSGLAMAVDTMEQVRPNQRRDLQKFAFGLFQHVYDQFGFKSVEGQQHGQLNGRQDALRVLVQYGHPEAVAEALQVFDRSHDHLEPFLRKPVYLAVVNSGSDEQFSQLVERLTQRTKSQYERQILIYGIVPYVPETNQRRQSLLSLAN